jgi:hypothetical protein
MKDFVMVPGIGLYRGWTEAQRRELLRRLIAEIVECAPEPVAAIVSLDARDMLSPIHQRFFGDPYQTAFQQVTRGLSLSAIPRHENAEPETVSMVYAYQSEFGAIQSVSTLSQNQGRAEALWHAIKKSTMFGQWMGGYASESPENLATLQAADLFAYEITHEFENQLKRPHLGMRWPLKQILRSAGRASLIKLFDFNTLIHTMLENGYDLSSETVSEDDISLAYSVGQRQIRDNLMERANA